MMNKKSTVILKSGKTRSPSNPDKERLVQLKQQVQDAKLRLQSAKRAVREAKDAIKQAKQALKKIKKASKPAKPPKAADKPAGKSVLKSDIKVSRSKLPPAAKSSSAKSKRSPARKKPASRSVATATTAKAPVKSASSAAPALQAIVNVVKPKPTPPRRKPEASVATPAVETSDQNLAPQAPEVKSAE